MTGAEVLETARAKGLTVTPTMGGLRVRGRGPRPLGVLEDLRRYRDEVLKLLTTCVRCGGADERLVLTYWSRWTERLCPMCRTQVVTEFETSRTWPEVPWSPGEECGVGVP